MENIDHILVEQIHTYVGDVAPLTKELADIEETVNKLEKAAYRLDAFTQRLEEKMNAYLVKNKAN